MNDLDDPRAQHSRHGGDQQFDATIVVRETQAVTDVVEDLVEDGEMPTTSDVYRTALRLGLEQLVADADDIPDPEYAPEASTLAPAPANRPGERGGRRDG